MTAYVTMTAAMEAHLRQLAARAFKDTQIAFDRAMSRTMTQPMPALTNTITFRIVTPKDGTREFTATFTLTELTTTTTQPTTGFDAAGQ